jgi:hypothetical protein
MKDALRLFGRRKKTEYRLKLACGAGDAACDVAFWADDKYVSSSSRPAHEGNDPGLEARVARLGRRSAAQDRGLLRDLNVQDLRLLSRLEDVLHREGCRKPSGHDHPMTSGPCLSDPGTYPSDRSSRGLARTQSNKASRCMQSDPFKDGNPSRSASALAAIDSPDVADIWIGTKPALAEFGAYCDPGYAPLKL